MGGTTTLDVILKFPTKEKKASQDDEFSDWEDDDLYNNFKRPQGQRDLEASDYCILGLVKSSVKKDTDSVYYFDEYDENDENIKQITNETEVRELFDNKRKRTHEQMEYRVYKLNELFKNFDCERLLLITLTAFRKILEKHFSITLGPDLDDLDILKYKFKERLSELLKKRRNTGTSGSHSAKRPKSAPGRSRHGRSRAHRRRQRSTTTNRNGLTSSPRTSRTLSGTRRRCATSSLATVPAPSRARVVVVLSA